MTIGVKGINLGEGDKVAAALAIRDKNDCLAIFSENGLAKKVAPSEMIVAKRAGKGVLCYKPTASSGKVVAATLVNDEDNVLVLGDKSSICVSAKEIPTLGRISLGNQIIKNSKIISVSKV